MKTSIQVLALILLFVSIMFQCDPDSDKCNPIEISAGDDIEVSSTSVMLNASPLESKQNGMWEVISGNNGILEDPSLFNTLFTGTSGATYVLRWTVSNGCSEASDEVQVTFQSTTSAKLKSITYTNEAGTLTWKEEYFYDTQGRLDSADFTDNGVVERHVFVYGTNGKIEIEKFNLYENKYFYQPDDGKLIKEERYKWNVLKTVKALTDTYGYTYQGDQTIQSVSTSGINVTYQLDSNGDCIKKVYNHIGGLFWSMTYYSDKLFVHPFSEIGLDFRNKHLLKSFSHSTAPSLNYNSTYTFDSAGNPKEETQTYSSGKVFGVYVFE